MLSIFLFAFSLLTNPNPEDLTISEAVSQGQALSVAFKSKAKSKPDYSLKFLEQSTPCYPEEQSEKWVCWSAVPPDTNPGRYKVQLFWKQKEIVAEDMMKVVLSSFPTEPLTLTDEKKNLEDSAEQVKIIRHALQTETPKKFAKGKYVQPVEGVVESLFGEKRVMDGVPLKSYHRGLDLGSPEGTPMISANH